MLENVSDKITLMLLQEKLIDDQDKEQYAYAICLLIENTISFISLMLVGALFKQIIPTLFWALLFMSLRKYTGGFHARSFAGCYITTIALYVMIAITTPMAVSHMTVIIFGVLMASLGIALLGTVNHPNMHLDETEMKEEKNAARYVLAIEVLIILGMLVLDADKALIYFCAAAIIVCGILMIVAKVIGQEVKQ